MSGGVPSGAEMAKIAQLLLRRAAERAQGVGVPVADRTATELGKLYPQPALPERTRP